MLKRLRIVFCLSFCWVIPVSAYAQIASIVGSVGAINQSMGGAATAMPLDAAGSQYWNPASITDLDTTELDVNVQPFFPQTALNSTLHLDVPGLPVETLSGELEGDSKVAVLPSAAFVKKIEYSPWRWGVLVTGSGGTSIKFNHKGDEPLTSPPPIGSGNFKVIGQFLQISPTLARRISPKWSVGIQPNFNLTAFKSQPFGRAAPADINLDGIPTYPRSQQATTVGLGVQGGVYYHNPNTGLHLGAAVKSPQWFLPYQSRVTYYLESNQQRTVSWRANLPMIVSFGIGYSKLPKIKLATDIRYINFDQTKGFNKVGYTKQGIVRGPGWRNIWAVASGVQYQVTKNLSIRSGYAFNQSPVRPFYTSFSIGSPSIINHEVSAGFSYQFNPHMTFVSAYEHGFSNSVEGPIHGIDGPILNSSVKLKTSLNSFVVGLVIKF